jgi:S1-C subfamily serine protease
MGRTSDGHDARSTGLALVAGLLVVIGIAIGVNGMPGRDAPAGETATMPAAPPPAAGPPPSVASPPVEGKPGNLPEAQGDPPPPTADPESDTPSVEEVVARAVDAVVLIEAGDSRGSGFFVTPDTLVTNVHVVGRQSHVTIRRADGRTASARVTSTAPGVDIAVLKVSPGDSSRTILSLGSGLNARVGQDVLAIGSALGTLQSTVTRGIVSAVRRSGEALLLQTDAAVNPGNSGGPLLDRRGVVVGITTMGYIDRQGLNFAVAIDHARPLIDGHSLPRAITALQSATPVANVDGLSPAVASESDQARSSGQKNYDDTLRRAAVQADGLDDYWQRYRRACQAAPGAARGSREWFVVLGPSDTMGAVDPGCSSWLDDIRERARAVGQTMAQAEETARRADVFPGVRRDLRRRYRLDFDGWDR